MFLEPLIIKPLTLNPGLGTLVDCQTGTRYVPEFNSLIAFDIPRFHEVTPRPYTLYFFTPYTLHFTPYTLDSASYILYSTLYTHTESLISKPLQPTAHSLQLKARSPQPSSHSPQPSSHSPQPTRQILLPVGPGATFLSQF